MGAHGAVASDQLGADVIEAVFSDPTTAPVSQQVQAALHFLEILTLRPDELSPTDLAEARTAGLDDDAIRDAAMVCALFSAITRLSDTLNFAIPASFDTTVKVLTSRIGYRFPLPVLLLPRL